MRTANGLGSAVFLDPMLSAHKSGSQEKTSAKGLAMWPSLNDEHAHWKIGSFFSRHGSTFFRSFGSQRFCNDATESLTRRRGYEG